jgi:hypothetical protein
VHTERYLSAAFDRSAFGTTRRSAFTLAKRIRRTVDRLDPQGVVLGERHLRHVLLSYMDYYNGTRTHLALNKDAPKSRAVEAAGRILSVRSWVDCITKYARA